MEDLANMKDDISRRKKKLTMMDLISTMIEGNFI
jgi:hypothetical protein